MSPGTSSILWPAVSGVLAIALVCVVLRRRREAKPAQTDSWRIVAEDALRAIMSLERDQRPVGIEALADVLTVSNSLAEEIVRVLLGARWIERDTTDGLRLTDEGRRRAHELIRAHRLWEQYLVERERMPVEAVHTEAHRREHATTPQQIADLDAELGHPARDPHGHMIPNVGGGVPESGGASLIECGVGKRLRVLHVADEPPALFAQLIAMGLTPGAELEVLERDPERLWVRVNEKSMPLAAAAAERVHASPAPVLPVSLGELSPGSHARVVEIRGTGKHQRRILDMGLVPGAQVSVVRTAPLGDPVEYLVKGSAVSMRRSDASTVLVDEETGQEDE